MRNMNTKITKNSFLFSVIFATIFLSLAVNLVLAAPTCSILPGDPAKSIEYCPNCPQARVNCEHKDPIGTSPVGQYGCACADQACAAWRAEQIANPGVDVCDWTSGIHICKAVCDPAGVSGLDACSQLAREHPSGFGMQRIITDGEGYFNGQLILQDYQLLGGCCNPNSRYSSRLFEDQGDCKYGHCIKVESKCTSGKICCFKPGDPFTNPSYQCKQDSDCCYSNTFCQKDTGECKYCALVNAPCGRDNPTTPTCCPGKYCAQTWSFTGGWKFNCRTIYIPRTTSGGCPILKAFNGNEFVTIEKLNIHSPKDEDTTYTTTFTMKPVNGKYEIILDEAAYLFWDGSHIDSVKLTDGTEKECQLISAIHSKDGNVLSAIANSDDVRVRSYPGDRIKLTYDGCSGNQFTFSIEGYNRKITSQWLDITSFIPIVIIIAVAVLAIIFGLLKLTMKKNRK